MKLSVLSKSLRISLAIYKGESSSEYERAYSLADMLMPQFLECLNAGMPRSEIVTHLMIGARVKREVATITICKKLKKIGYVQKAIEDDEEDIPDDLDISAKSAKVKSEVSKKVFLKQKPAPDQVVAADKPVATPAQRHADKISATAESNSQPPTSGFRGSIKIGNNFHGIDDVGKQAEQDREANIRAIASLEALEQQYGKPKFNKP